MAASSPEMLNTWLRNRGASALVQREIKSAIAVLDTAGTGLAPTKPMVQALLAAVDRRSVLGQLGAIKVPQANVGGVAQTVSATSYWVGEALAKAPSALGFAALSLTPRKVTTNVIAAEELLRFANVDALALLERAVVSATAAALDVALLDPANAGIAGVKPPSLTNGLTTIPPLLDFQNQVGQALNAISGGSPSRPTLIVSLQTALRLSALPNIADYVKVIVSPAASNKVIAVDADGIAYVDDGGNIDIGAPDMQLNDVPADPSTATTIMTSLWQRDLRAIRVERWVSWAKRADAVAYLTLA